MTRKLLTWPLAFVAASAVILAAAAGGWSTATTAAALGAALVVFVLVAVPVAEGLGPRRTRAAQRSPH